MSMLSAFLAHKGLVLATIAAGALLVIYVMPLGSSSMSEVLAAKGGDPGPPIPPTPGEGYKYGWVKAGEPPPFTK